MDDESTVFSREEPVEPVVDVVDAFFDDIFFDEVLFDDALFDDEAGVDFFVAAMRVNLAEDPGDAGSEPGQAYDDNGSQVHTKFRSPCAASIRPTGTW